MTVPMQSPGPNLSVQLSIPARNVDTAFQVTGGQTMALTGPNGAGKTTTLLTLAGWLIPDTGVAQLGNTVLFDCPDPMQRPAVWTPALNRGIGYLSQNAQLFPHLTTRQNIMYGMQRAGVKGHKAQRTLADQWLERIGLSSYGKHKPHQLSGGQAQRVAIARVLASGPRLVLLDEPFAALDVNAAPAIRCLLAEVLAQHTVVLVTHHSEDIVALADHVYQIDLPSGSETQQ